VSDASLRIKNLSISLEALSRINGYGASGLYVDIETLLGKEIKALKEEQEQPLTAPPARPTIPNPDDDIPF
jgi:hypothetical protein